MRTPGERTSGAWTGGCVIHPDGGDETDRTAGNSYTATPHNTQGANSGQVLIEKYINLKAGSRETIIDFITDVVAALEDLDPNAKAFPSGSASELDIDAEVEAYRQQLELQKKAAAGSSLSNGGNGGANKKEA